MSKVEQLGYMVFQAQDLNAWRDYATGVLGVEHAGTDDDGSLVLRLDSYAQRLRIEPGPADDLVALGWQLPNEAALLGLAERLQTAGVPVHPGTSEQAQARRVSRLLHTRDPAGLPLELFCGAERAATPFRAPIQHAGFVAEELGVGHIVISARNKQESYDFYTGLLGLQLSDHIVCEIHGYPVDITFLHANGRHHSLAFGERQAKRLHHFMLEVRAMDDVGLAFDRTLRSGLRIMQTLGRHPNDRMFSFYAMTPSGFQFEYGWGARTVDDATWQATTYDRISEWGHHPPSFIVRPPGRT